MELEPLVEQNAEPCRGSRIAFFGGSFDPPHLGHVAVARAARTALGLDTVLFAPVGAQPLKPQGSTAGFAHRLAMTRLAIAGEEGFAVSLADAPHPAGSPNYTLETLLRLRAELPSESQLFCLMGADSFAGLRRWRGAQEIPFAAPLIVASRPSEPLRRLGDLRAILPEGLRIEPETGAGRAPSEIELHRYVLHNSAGDSVPFFLLPGLEIGISASQIRDQVRASKRGAAGGGEPLSEAVSAYIREHRLYG